MIVSFQALLYHKATDVNIEGRNKYTPLHNAAHLEHRNALEICQKLVRMASTMEEFVASFDLSIYTDLQKMFLLRNSFLPEPGSIACKM